MVCSRVADGSYYRHMFFVCSWTRTHPLWSTCVASSKVQTASTAPARTTARAMTAGQFQSLATPSAAVLLASSARLSESRYFVVLTCVPEPIHWLTFARASLQSVSFSGPGLYYANGQFKTKIADETLQPNLAEAVNLGTTFIPSSDVVPRLDSQVGNIQQTACSDTNLLHCHSISTMICDLLFRCGDDQNQKRFKDCTGRNQTFDYDTLRLSIFP